ncbi:hypothetical protein VP01_6946g1 [Puccinia sorghi]|uniref:Uncharacterized protein n=1 Tax=Puccinia sorghi TaxID=27349 RepID=A0A0L6UE56_9BASI|nr:hypothetical protein VP01_6946g1 [Puccinia sorghi]
METALLDEGGGCGKFADRLLSVGGIPLPFGIQETQFQCWRPTPHDNRELLKLTQNANGIEPIKGLKRLENDAFFFSKESKLYSSFSLSTCGSESLMKSPEGLKVFLLVKSLYREPGKVIGSFNDEPGLWIMEDVTEKRE